MKKGIAIALVCITAICGNYCAVSGITPDSASSVNTGNYDPVDIGDYDQTDTGSDAALEKADVSDNTASGSETKITPLFTPTKRINGDIYTAQRIAGQEEDKQANERFKMEYGIDPGKSGVKLNAKQEAMLSCIYVDCFVERYDELRQKFVEDGYGDKELLFTEDVDFISDEYVLRYCSILNMVCNAYNDQDYYISDSDRITLLQAMIGSLDCLNDYVRKHQNCTPDDVKDTIEYLKQTYAAEYGHRPLEG